MTKEQVQHQFLETDYAELQMFASVKEELTVNKDAKTIFFMEAALWYKQLSLQQRVISLIQNS